MNTIARGRDKDNTPLNPAIQSRHRGMGRRGLLLAALLSLAACTSDGPLFPGVPPGELLLVPGAGNATLAVVDVRTGKLVRRVYKEDFFSIRELRADGRIMYGRYCNCIPGSGVHREEVVAVDLPSGNVRWRLPVRDWLTPNVIDGIALYSADYLNVSHDGTVIYLGQAQQGDAWGVVALDSAPRRPIAFSGPWNLSSFGPLPPSTPYPEGALLVLGTPGTPGSSHGLAAAYLLHPRSLAMLDSIPTAAVGGLALWQIVRTPDPHTLYLTNARELMRFDLPTKTVTASVARESPGLVNYMPGLRQLVLFDAGANHLTAGSGLLHVYTDDLRPLGAIDVGTPFRGEQISTFFGLAGSDPRYLYVRSGSYGMVTEPARLLVVDLVQRRFEGAFYLNGPPGGRLYHIPPSWRE